METVIGFLSHLASRGVKLAVESGQLNCYARKGMLTSELRDGILRYKTEIISLLEARTPRPEGTKVVEFPLSAGEKGLYLLQQMHPEMSAYNLPICVRIRGPIDTARLAAAWTAVLEHFPILTARILEKDGTPHHRLDDTCRSSLQLRSVEVDDDAFVPFLQEQVRRPFDLHHGPLARIELFQRTGESPTLLLTVHHLIFDGASAMIVLKSLFELHQLLGEGKPARLPQQLHGYHEFVQWEEAMLAIRKSTPAAAAPANEDEVLASILWSSAWPDEGYEKIAF